MKKNHPSWLDEIKVAVVYEPLYKMGGGELHLKYILEAFPNSELFTAYYDDNLVKKNFKNRKINASFLQKLPWRNKLRYIYLLFLPMAYKSFRFKDFDVIISLSSHFAKFANQKGVQHIDICMTPPKFLWQKEDRTLKKKSQLSGINKFFFGIYSFFMDTALEDVWRKWDKEAAQKCDRIVAISNVVKKRVEEYYGVNADVIYPPVEVSKIAKYPRVNRKENWFLYLGRVEKYKGVHLAIKACNKLDLPLKIAGTGDDLEAMKQLVDKLAAKGIVKFLGYVSEDEKYELLSRAKALIFPVRGEDFGIVPVEANAFGTPVIAYKDGGPTETISLENPATGVFFEKYTVESLVNVLKKFKPEKYTQDNCIKQSQNFASEIFIYKLQNYVKDTLQIH
jgi:glycosyltransferase involved in cell wall biosynthesis